MKRWLRQLRRTMRGARLVDKGQLLERAGRLEEAREFYTRARETAGPPERGAFEGALDSVRLMAVTRLACVAAALEDHPAAETAAREGLGLCAAARISAPLARKLEFVAEWEGWARRYLSSRP
jgi:hypothetical protein